MNEVQNDELLSPSEKQNILNLLSNRKGIEEALEEVRTDKIRQLQSFKDYQIFLKSEHIKKIPVQSHEKVENIDEKLKEIGKRKT